MLFWVASYPRSGNRFFRTLIQSLCEVPTTDIEFCESLMRDLLGNAAVETLNASRARQVQLAATKGPTPVPPLPPWADRPLAEIVADPRAFAIKTHCVIHDANLPAVYLIRDGRDAMVSYARFAPLYGKDISPEQFRKNLVQRINYTGGRYGSWSENIASWINRPNTCVLSFTDLIERPIESVQKAIDTLRLPLEIVNTQVPTFDELKARNPELYRRGKAGSWQDEFPADLLPLFWEKHGAMMHKLGFTDDVRASA
jgi:hypothetical protein